MEKYFQMSDKTRTLEQQYAGLLTKRSEIEIQLVEEDYNKLLVSYEELVTATRNDEDRHREQIDGLNALVDELNRNKAENEEMQVKLLEEKKHLADTIRELEEKKSRGLEEDKQSIKKLKKEVKELNEMLGKRGHSEISEVHAVLKSVKDNLENMLDKLQESHVLHKMELEKINEEVNMLKSRNVESVDEAKNMKKDFGDIVRRGVISLKDDVIREIREEVEKLREIPEEKKCVSGPERELELLKEANLRLREENAVLSQNRKLMKEKDEIISALRENMKQKSELIDMQRTLIKGAGNENVVRGDDICNVFDEEIKAEESGNELLLLENECNNKGLEQNWKDVPVKPRLTKRKITTTATKVMDRDRKPASKPAHKPLRKPNDAKKASSGINVEVPPEVPKNGGMSGKFFVPGNLLKPENSSYFADLTFSNSSPVNIRKDKPSLPKKK